MTERDVAILSMEEDTSLDSPASLMRWKAKCECPVCQSNSNVVRAKGLPFPSGHTSAPAHDGCTCACVPLTQEKRLLNDVDELVEFNPYHGQHGRFASGQGGGSSGTTEPERANHAALSALEEHMSARFPDTHFDFTGGNPEVMTGVCKQLDHLMSTYPEVGKTLAYIGTGNDVPQGYGMRSDGAGVTNATLASCRMTEVPYNVMNLNPAVFGSDKATIDAKIDSLAQREWYPAGAAGNGLEYVVAHEFGHAVDFYLSSRKANVSATKGTSNIGTTHETFKANNAKTGNMVSVYAQTSATEAFAEGFASFHLTPASQQTTYTQRLGKHLSKVLPGGRSASWTASPYPYYGS